MGRTPRHILREQALLVLLACGQLSKSQLASILAAHTGKKAETIRRAFEGERDTLRALEDAWLIEKNETGKLVITPLGIRALENTVTIDSLLVQVAMRLEEWEPNLSGLSCIIRHAKETEKPEHIGNILYNLINFIELWREGNRDLRRYRLFDGSNGIEVLESLVEAYFPYTVSDLIELLKEHKRTRNLSELNEVISDHIKYLENIINTSLREAYEAITKCRNNECVPNEENRIEKLFEGGADLGLLIEVQALRKDFVEQATGWPHGQPPLRARLALREAGSLLRKIGVSDIVSGLEYCRNRVSKLLVPLLTVHVINKLVLSLDKIYTNLDAISKHYGTLALAITNIESSDIRQVLAFLVLLRDIIARFREYWIDVMLSLQGKSRRKRLFS